MSIFNSLLRKNSNELLIEVPKTKVIKTFFRKANIEAKTDEEENLYYNLERRNEVALDGNKNDDFIEQINSFYGKI